MHDLVQHAAVHARPPQTQLARSYPIKDAAAAYAELAGNKVNGKRVLVIDESLV